MVEGALFSAIFSQVRSYCRRRQERKLKNPRGEGVGAGKASWDESRPRQAGLGKLSWDESRPRQVGPGESLRPGGLGLGGLA